MTRERLWYYAFVLLFAGSMMGAGAFMARGAELKLPPYITCGQRVCDGDISRFGTYSLKYYQRRWKRMCAGPARYDAMREANEMRRPNPCT